MAPTFFFTKQDGTEALIVFDSAVQMQRVLALAPPMSNPSFACGAFSRNSQTNASTGQPIVRHSTLAGAWEAIDQLLAVDRVQYPNG